MSDMNVIGYVDQLSDICKNMLRTIAGQLSDSTFELWFADLTLIRMDEEEAVFRTDTNFRKKILTKKYPEIITEALEEIVGFPVKISIVSAEEEHTLTDEPSAVASGASPELKNIPEFAIKRPQVINEIDRQEEEEDKPSIARAIEGNSIVHSYTFDNFIEGTSNKFAYVASKAVANSPGDVYNPLFIYGPSGLGKTHLLFAITNELKRKKPGVHIVYKRGEEFTNELISAIGEGTTPQFRDKYRNADVLLIDDIQFIAGKESTQEEFFHTFSCLYENQKQIILTSDRPPREMRALEDRLRTRFEWGLLADIQPPNAELRAAIILKKAEQYNLRLNPEVVQFLVDKCQDNVRQIEGAIRKIYAVCSLTSCQPDLEITKRAVADLQSGVVSVQATVDRVIDAVSERFGVSIPDLKSVKRTANIARARHISIFVIRKLTNLSLDAVGEIFGHRDHTTILSSENKVLNDMNNDRQLAGDVDEIIRKVNNQ